MPCSPGTFMADVAQLACVTCSPGLYNNAPGRSFCDKCDAGSTYNSSTTCQFCSPGTFSALPGTTQCTPCLPNFYAPVYGLLACLPCPFNSRAPPGSSSCAPNSGFFMFNNTVYPCPLGANCTSDSEPTRTLHTMASLAGFWRWVNPNPPPITQYYVPLFYPVRPSVVGDLVCLVIGLC